jgi:hypothetical protein
MGSMDEMMTGATDAEAMGTTHTETSDLDEDL